MKVRKIKKTLLIAWQPFWGASRINNLKRIWRNNRPNGSW